MSADNDIAPDILYKYFPPWYGESLEDGIIPYFETNQKLRLSQPGALNDPYECLPDFSEAQTPKFSLSRKDQKLLDRKIKEDNGYSYLEMQKVRARAKAKIRGERRDHPEIEQEALFKSYTSLADQSFGILSLSSSWKNAVMWAHYAQQHTGFVLGFHKNHPALNNLPILEVDYKYERFKFLGDPSNRDDLNHQINSIIKTKSDSWEYEKEWRLIGAILTLETLSESQPTNKLSILGLSFPYQALAEVVLGKNIDSAIEDSITNALPNHAKIYKAKLNSHSFDLDRS